MSIVVRNLVKKYEDQAVLDGISFDIPNGGIVGFLGPNGAGKSTTIKIITGYIEPDEGSVEIFNKPVNNNSMLVKSMIGYLPESNPLYSDFYVREYLGFVADIYRVKNKNKVIEDYLDLLGLRLECAKKIEQLSKGYKQRVGLAASMLHNPEILILDEPTSGLDPNQILEIRNLIRKIGNNKTVLFSTHYLQEVEALCDKVIIINKGKIMENDSLANIKSKYDENIVKVEFGTTVEYDNFRFLENYYDDFYMESSNILVFQTKHPEVIKKQIMELTLSNNLKLLKIEGNTLSLEKIFNNITTSI